MFDWIGSLRLAERSGHRVVLSLSRSTQIVGWVVFAIGSIALIQVWPVSRWLATLPGFMSLLGLTLITLRRKLTFDRHAGVLEVEQRMLGFVSKSVVPLFHLRAVVVAAQSHTGRPVMSRYLAFVERRIGEPIYLDEARRCARLLRLAEAISEVTELRFEYEATPNIG